MNSIGEPVEGKPRKDFDFLYCEDNDRQTSVARSIGQKVQQEGEMSIGYNDAYNPTGITGTVPHAINSAVMVEVCIPVVCDSEHNIMPDAVSEKAAKMARAITATRPLARSFNTAPVTQKKHENV